jgi:hypothetical protein
MPQPVKDMTGMRFGRLVVLHRGVSQVRSASWRCRCDCGVEITVRGDLMRRGEIKSCGCLRREQAQMNATAAAVKLSDVMRQRHRDGVYDHLKKKQKDWSAINKKTAARVKAERSHKAKDATPTARPKEFSATAAADLEKAWK